MAFFSGNEVFWKTRWENSIDGSGTAYRTLVSYKETHAGAKIDPIAEWTGTWRDPRFSPPADGGRPENALTGTIFTVNSGTAAIVVPGRRRQDAPVARHDRGLAGREPGRDHAERHAGLRVGFGSRQRRAPGRACSASRTPR